jgi:hypothetical protein
LLKRTPAPPTFASLITCKTFIFSPRLLRSYHYYFSFL